VWFKKRRFKYTLPGEQPQRPAEQRHGEEETRLSRRLLLMRGGIGVGFAVLAGKLWHMQIASGSDFEEVVEGNVLRFERLKAARGRIVDRNGVTLAENRSSWTVRVVPGRLPDEDDPERQRVLDWLGSSLGLGQALVIDRRMIPAGSEAAVVNELAKRMQIDGAALLAELDQPGVRMVLVKGSITPEEAATFTQTFQDVPGISVHAMIDYQITVHTSDDTPLVLKRDVDRETAMLIGSNTIYLPGVSVDDFDLARLYPAGTTFSHILGYVGPITGEEYDAAATPSGTAIYDQDDLVGRGGIEQAMEQELRGTKGGRWVQVDSLGVERFELLDRRREPISGLTVQLTIDSQFQTRVTEILQEGILSTQEEAKKVQREKVTAGVAIAMNPKNGEIKAMVSLPTFNNQDFVAGISEEKYRAYADDPDSPLLNRAISGTYAPGSTIKPVYAAAALQRGIVNTQTTFDCKGTMRVPWSWDETQGNDYVCWVGPYEPHGPVDIYKAIAESCDIYFYNVGAPRQKPDVPGADWVHYYNPNDPERHYFHGLGIDALDEVLGEEFGFGRASGIELAGEAEGLVPTQKWLYQTLGENWSIGDTINVSIGQGHLLSTPLQMLNATVALCNGGTLWRPRLVKALVNQDGKILKEFEPKALGNVPIAQEHLETVREGMRQTMTVGTGAGKITFAEPAIGGKSGTAEYGIAVDGKYKLSHAWFSAFGPYANPDIAVVVLIVGGMAGSTYAGPVVNRILDTYFHG
jgi:penicillin-binding protein 2